MKVGAPYVPRTLTFLSLSQLTTVVFSEGGDMFACGSAYIVRASPYPTLLEVKDALMGLAGKQPAGVKSTLSSYQVGGQRRKHDDEAQP